MEIGWLEGLPTCAGLMCVCVCACIRIIQINGCLLIPKCCQNHQFLKRFLWLQVIWYIRQLFKECVIFENLLRLELCHIKGIYYIIEQPTSSLLFRYKPIKQLLERHGASFVRCALGAYNASTLKPVFCLQTKP